MDNRTNKGLRNSLGAGIAIGAGLGVALGLALDNLALGIAIGVSLGVAIGAARGTHEEGAEPPSRTAMTLGIASIALGAVILLWLIIMLVLR